MCACMRVCVRACVCTARGVADRRPAKLVLAGGVKVTRGEYDSLKALGLDIALPAKAAAAAAAAAAQ